MSRSGTCYVGDRLWSGTLSVSHRAATQNAVDSAGQPSSRVTVGGGVRTARASLAADRLSLGKTLYESGQPVDRAYFPTTAIVSLHYVMRDGASAEVAGVGNEGMVGFFLCWAVIG